ncbi:ribonuclease H-like domain-containing protein [Clostridiaceae bacterium M8S5]|nr:ribonuclease H-like domain-containing protein [Clostridiaceae bacterium M8S5]
MITIKDKKQIDFDICGEFNRFINYRNYCFFDIETTGFSGARNKVILIGILYFENNEIIINQFFSESPDDEVTLLIESLKLINKFDTYITYNGDTFDVPFVNKRLQYHNINEQLKKENGLDLIKVVRKNKQILGLEDCKLKSVEKCLGIYRDDKISGKESIDLYKKYVKKPSTDLLETILKHNYDDIYYLPQLLGVYPIISEHKFFSYDFLFNDNNICINFNLDETIFDKNTMSVKIKTSPLSIPKFIHYSDLYNLEWNFDLGELTLDIIINKGKLTSGNKCLYIDLEYIDSYIYDTSTHTLPSNILIVKEKNALYYENIKQLLNFIFENVFTTSDITSA